MIHKVIELNIDYKKIDTVSPKNKPTLSLYFPSNSSEIEADRKRPTVIICPGGGYEFTTDREAEPVALKFLAEDCNVAVLRYSVSPVRFPAQITELALAVSIIRKNAKEYNVDTEKIAILGFSAGGHLTATYCNLWNKGFIKEYFGFENEENKPNGMILCYPVITSGEKTHIATVDNILGDKKYDPELLDLISAEKQVNAHTPPAFIWHTFEDQGVPVENSLLMASALAEKKINTELHIFPKGPHALSICDISADSKLSHKKEFEHYSVWVKQAIHWLKNL